MSYIEIEMKHFQCMRCLQYFSVSSVEFAKCCPYCGRFFVRDTHSIDIISVMVED